MSAESDNSRNSLLIAMPQLADPNFFHTVSLLVSFDSKGAFGLILNRPLELAADQLIGDQLDIPNAQDIPVYFGGPVQTNSLWFLHSYPEFSENAVQVLDHLYLTTELKVVEAVVKRYAAEKNPNFRFILGYAGWAPGQLEQEIALASWVTGPIDAKEIFTCESPELWDASLARLGIHDPSVLVSPVTSGTAH